MVNSLVVFAFSAILSVQYIFGDFLYHDSRFYEGSPCRTTDKRRGKCKTDCSTLTEEQSKENVCGFVKSDVLYCCPRILLDGTNQYPLIEQACADRFQIAEDRNQSDEELSKRSAEEDLRKSKAVGQFINIVPSINSELMASCENFSTEVGGNEINYFHEWCEFLFVDHSYAQAAGVEVTSIYKHPHMAALGWIYPDNSTDWNCGGSLIHPNFVVTAAHCMFNIGREPDIVVVSAISLSQGDHTHDIEAIFTHGQFDPEAMASSHDIALIKVKRRKELEKNRAPLPACLWTKPEYPSNQLLMMGYGAPTFGKKFQNRLFEGNLSVVEQTRCVNIYGPTGILLTETQFCAADPEGEKDTCEGDSGGPLQFNADDEWQTPYVVGITSFGVTCVTGPPGVYTKVYDYLGWIEKIMRENLLKADITMADITMTTSA